MPVALDIREEDPSAIFPASGAAVVTPHDDNDLTVSPTRALWVGTGGDLAVIFADEDTELTVVGVPSGTLLPFQVTRVLVTGTTADDILALY
jgi:hypothetical protein